MRTVDKSEVNNVVYKIGYRPTNEIYMAFGFGIVLVIIPVWFFKVIGVISLILGAFAFIKLKDHLTMEIAKDRVYIHQNNEIKELLFDEIKVWEAKSNAQSVGNITFILNDDDMIVVNTYQPEKANRLLTKFINEKEKNEKAINDRKITHKVELSFTEKIKLLFSKSK
ncbi:MAG: hypothetical protein MR210_00645 [Erysipelotrichaceae bacterium]|nr:hypothetical protein [Erysipelotrichaceae bacterium]MDY5252568.1 hypothetical protein [Erysipelotrichaceae bacterium]